MMLFWERALQHTQQLNATTVCYIVRISSWNHTLHSSQISLITWIPFRFDPSFTTTNVKSLKTRLLRTQPRTSAFDSTGCCRMRWIGEKWKEFNSETIDRVNWDYTLLSHWVRTVHLVNGALRTKQGNMSKTDNSDTNSLWDSGFHERIVHI